MRQARDFPAGVRASVPTCTRHTLLSPTAHSDKGAREPWGTTRFTSLLSRDSAKPGYFHSTLFPLMSKPTWCSTQAVKPTGSVRPNQFTPLYYTHQIACRTPLRRQEPPDQMGHMEWAWMGSARSMRVEHCSEHQCGGMMRTTRTAARAKLTEAACTMWSGQRS